jgi:hypothetical protein
VSFFLNIQQFNFIQGGMEEIEAESRSFNFRRPMIKSTRANENGKGF